MTIKVKVSAIVSAYFAADYLAGRLENLMEQDPQPEIIVICQTDSMEFHIASNHAGVKIITTPDIPTIYAAWNLGIEAASGEYITNANCDDRLFPGTLAKMAAILDGKPAYALVYGNQDIVSEIGGDPTGKFEWAEGGIEELLKGCFCGPMPMWRKSLHAKHGYFDPEMQVAGDYEFWLRITKAGERLYHIKDTVGSYLSIRTSAEKRQRNLTSWETARARARYRKGIGIWQ